MRVTQGRGRVARVVLTWLLLSSLAVIAACGGNGGANPAATQTKVAFIPVGPITDKSWSQSGYTGLMKAKADFNLQVAFSEQAVPPADAERIARTYVSQGYKLIIFDSAQFVTAAKAVSAANPSLWFCVGGAIVSSPPSNVCSYDPLAQQGAFLAGATAGLMTKTGRLGLVGGFAFPQLTRQLEGFKLGARYVKPDVKFQEVYINNWDDPAKGKDAANALIAAGADVVFAATDQASQGVFAAAEQRGVYAVASYIDQNSLAPKTILGSVQYDLSSLVYSSIQHYVQKDIGTGGYTAGLEKGVGLMAYNNQLLPTAVVSKIDSIKQNIISGKIKIPGTDALGTPGASSKIDIASLTS